MTISHSEVAHGWTLADLDSLARSVVSNNRSWWPAGDRQDHYDTAWHGIAEHLCSAADRPSRIGLMEAGRRAVATEVRDGQRHHGARSDGSNTGEKFARYWDWHSAPVASPEGAVTDRLATRQILAALTGRQQQAVMALAVLDDYRLAAETLGIRPQTYRALLGRSREAFRELWHEGEIPSGQWGTDRRALRHDTDSETEIAYRARYAAQRRELRAQRKAA